MWALALFLPLNQNRHATTGDYSNTKALNMETSLKQRIANQRALALVTTPTVSIQRLRDLLAEAVAANRTIVTVDIACEDTGIKKDCPIPVAGKVSRLTGFIQKKAGMYERSVEAQREREEHPSPEYEATTPNYAWIDSGPFAAMKDRTCLPMKVQSSHALYYNAEGNLITDDLSEWLKRKTPPLKQELERPIDWRAPYLDNVIEASINGEAVVIGGDL